MAETAAVVVTKLTDSQRDFVTQLSRPNTKIDVNIPTEIDPREWTKSAEAVCRACALNQMQGETLFTALGRLLVIAQDNKAIWEGRWETFEQFLEAEVITKYNIGRSTCFESIRVIKRWPDLPMADYRAIGRVKFKLLAKVIPVGDEDKATPKKLLEMFTLALLSSLPVFGFGWAPG